MWIPHPAQRHIYIYIYIYICIILDICHIILCICVCKNQICKVSIPKQVLVRAFKPIDRLVNWLIAFISRLEPFGFNSRLTDWRQPTGTD